MVRLFVFLACVLGTNAYAKPPALNQQQLQAGIEAFWKQRNIQENRTGEDAAMRWKVTSFEGCVPAFDEKRSRVWTNHWICVGQTTLKDFYADALIQVKGKNWQVIDLGGEPACASLKEAQLSLRKITGIEQLEITEEIDDGQGLFTNDRLGRGVTHFPYRIACRYESNLGTYYVFLWYQNGRYVFDAGDMSGTGVPEPWFVRRR
jgi:hypothetical protein